MYRRIIALGSGGSFPLRASNGSAAAPSYSFSSETNTGMYLSSAGNLTFSIGGTPKCTLSGNNFQVGSTKFNVFTNSGSCTIASGGFFAFSSGADAGTGLDTSVTRLGPALVGLGNGSSLTDFSATLKCGPVILTAAAATAAASQVSIGGTTATTVGAAGGASALPATPLGYLIINVAGTAAKIPYYNN